MQTPTKRTGPTGSPQKVCSRVSPTLKINSVGSSSGSSSTRTQNRSPKGVERRSPRSPGSSEKKRPGRTSELESQISQLQGDLKKLTDQLISSESLKREAQTEAELVKTQFLAVSSKLEKSQKQLSELTSSEGSHTNAKIENIFDEEKKQARQSQLETVQRHPLFDSDALASALDEIQGLKLQLDTVLESQGKQTNCQQSNDVALQSLKENLAGTVLVVEGMRNELNDRNTSEAQELVMETLMQLEAAKGTVNSLILGGTKSIETHGWITSELELSRARVDLLEGLVCSLKTDVIKTNGNLYAESNLQVKDHNVSGNQNGNQLEAELATLRSEVRILRCALEAAENRNNKGLAQNNLQMSAYEVASNVREAELEAELRKARADIEGLKANLMDKENELQGISEENEGLNMKLTKKTASRQKEHLLDEELKKLRKDIGELRANLMDKETELQNISEENKILKSEINKKQDETDTSGGPTTQVDQIASIEAARAAERDALTKLSNMAEETEKSNKKAARALEQLETAKAAYSEMETELRRLRVQSDQWRKAAEAAASMLSPASNGKFVERTGSMDSSGYGPFKGRIASSPCLEEYEDDAFKKRNGNMLKKIGVLWKKPQK